MWPALVFNLVAALVIAGLFIRSVRRLECRMDARYRKFNEWADAEDAKFDIARDEIRTSMRVQIDRAIAEMLTKAKDRAGEKGNAEVLQYIDTVRLSLAEVVPTRDEIKLLPQWAQVAFAVRCARRVLPLVKHFWRDAPEQHWAFDNAVSFAENAASHVPTHANASAAANATAKTAANDKVRTSAHSARRSAGYAFLAAGDASDAARATAYTTIAANESAEAANEATLIRADFEMIHGLTLANGWTDETPVPPSVFGPLWPEGPPEGWPMQEKAATEIVFEFDIPDEMTTDNAVEFVKELSAALCSLDLAGVGHGLAIQPPLEITAPVPVPASSPI